jgi:hypothetical protein
MEKEEPEDPTDIPVHRSGFPANGVIIHDGTVHTILQDSQGGEWRLVTRNVDMRIWADDDNNVYFEPARGTFYGGTIEARAVIPNTDTFQVNLMITIRDADVAELSKGTPFLENPVSGRFNAVFSLGFGDERTEEGRIVAGKADISEGNLWEFPALFGVLAVLSLDGSDHKIEEGEVRFLLRDSRIVIEQLDLRGHPVSLYGSGWVDFTSKNLEITFVPVAGMLPPIIRPIEALTWLIGGTLFPVTVTGSWEDAQAEVGDKTEVPEHLRKMAEEGEKR